ncbi:MAG: hypothetical protein C4562_04105 [Actinobacteria bacterium]|nr:MAG: hypothetical protein C4562_04105 [Actinomycetota bacterium]
MPRLNKKLVQGAVLGYKKGHSYARKQRLMKLKSLSAKESLAIFLSLWQAWNKTENKTSSKAIDKLKINNLIERRKRIDELARWKQGA